MSYDLFLQSACDALETAARSATELQQIAVQQHRLELARELLQYSTFVQQAGDSTDMADSLSKIMLHQMPSEARPAFEAMQKQFDNTYLQSLLGGENGL